MASTGFRGTPSQLYSVALTHMDKDPDDRDINTEEQADGALAEGGTARRARRARRGRPAQRAR